MSASRYNYKFFNKKANRMADDNESSCLAISNFGIITYIDMTAGIFDDVTDDYEVLQSTGLTDKNGKEIFEGDLVHYLYQPGEGMWNEDFVGIISWRSTGFHIEPAQSGGVSGWLCSLPGAYEPNCRELFEIVGNKFANPDLMKS